MIEKQQPRSSSAYHSINYHERKVEKGDAEVLLSNIEYDSVKDAADQFDYIKTTSKHKLGAEIYHSSINLAPGTTLSNDQFREIAVEYLSKMGFDDNPFIVYRHYDKGEQEHIHIVTTMYKFNPDLIVSDRFSKNKANKIIVELAEKYGIDTKTKTAVKRLGNLSSDQKPTFKASSEKEQSAKHLNYPLRSLKAETQKKVNYAFKNSKDPQKIASYLYRQGIEIILNTNSSGISGISFKLINPTIRSVPFDNIPTDYNRVKFEPLDLMILETQGVLQKEIAGKKIDLIRTSNNLVSSLKIEEQLKKALEKEIVFKGSSFKGKELSWNKLKNHFDQEQKDLGERIEKAKGRGKNSKLLVSIENGYYHGIREAIESGERVQNIEKEGIDVYSYYWKKAREIERAVEFRIKRDSKLILSQEEVFVAKALNKLISGGEVSTRTDIIVQTFIGLTPEGIVSEQNSYVDALKTQIDKKSYQLYPDKLVHLKQIPEGLREAISSIRNKNFRSFEKSMVFNDEFLGAVRTIQAIAGPDHRDFIKTAIRSIIKGRRDVSQLSNDTRRFLFSIEDSASGDLKDENTLQRD